MATLFASLAFTAYVFYVYRYCIIENMILKKAFGYVSFCSIIISLCIFLDYALYMFSDKITKSKWYLPALVMQF